MNTTIQQQIAAIKAVREYLEEKKIFVGSRDIDQRLNDALSTIQSVEIIGEKKVIHAAEAFDLLQTIYKVLYEIEDCMPVTIDKLRKLLSKVNP